MFIIYDHDEMCNWDEDDDDDDDKWQQQSFPIEKLF